LLLGSHIATCVYCLPLKASKASRWVDKPGS
jgi:hypothetical protein